MPVNKTAVKCVGDTSYCSVICAAMIYAADMSTRLQVDGVTHTENLDILNSVGGLWRGGHIPLE